jgi:TolB-like protein
MPGSCGRPARRRPSTRPGSRPTPDGSRRRRRTRTPLASRPRTSPRTAPSRSRRGSARRPSTTGARWSGARLCDAALQAATRRAETALEAGRPETAAGAAEAAPRLDPADEAGRRALIRALSALGRRAEALRRYAAFRAHLAEDLGIGPDPRTAAPAEHVRRAGEALPDAPPPRPDRPSIAVPPFRDLTGAEGRRHPVDGPAGSIPDDLARDRALFVIAETSGRLHRDTSLGPREIAAELGIRHLPSGRARLDRRRLRLDVELVDAVRGAIVRPERHDRPRADMPSVQDEIAGRIVAALRGCKASSGGTRSSALARGRRPISTPTIP